MTDEHRRAATNPAAGNNDEHGDDKMSEDIHDRLDRLESQLEQQQATIDAQ